MVKFIKVCVFNAFEIEIFDFKKIIYFRMFKECYGGTRTHIILLALNLMRITLPRLNLERIMLATLSFKHLL